MKANVIKKSEDKLEKKKAKLQKLIESKNQLEIKIKSLRTEIETLQANQFEQFKKAAKKENIEIKSEDIPEILKLIKNFQQNSQPENNDTDNLNESDFEISNNNGTLEDKDTEQTGLRTLSDLQSISSIIK